ncbi:GlxA family transcriptional regulator [Stenotrophomonas maltophilia]|nr:GlxA family transcriptional regulator [Stenotrophomonas maltophilia]
MRTVVIMAFPSVHLLDVTGPADVFAEATQKLNRKNGYRTVVVGLDEKPIEGTSGLRILPSASIEDEVDGVDTLIVAGGPSIDLVANNENVLAWLRHQATKVRRIASVCSGAFVLGSAGLLSGKRVTTHWNAAERFSQKFPDSILEVDRIFVRDGSIYTSAGVTAGMDLALALVEEDHGRAIALSVARELVMFLKRPGGQSQFSAHLAAQLAEKPSIGDVQEFILAHLAEDLSIPALASRALMSERNFARIFKRETQCTPAEFVEVSRVDAARNLMESSNLPLKSVAVRCGFVSVDGMRRAFLRQLGVGPADYRQRFRSSLSS